MKYKKTKFGLIPDDWKIVKVGQIGKVVTGSTPSTKKAEYYGGDTPFITPTDMDGTKVIDRTGRHLTNEGVRVSRPIPQDSVCITCIASIGKACIALKKSVTNQQINSILPNDKFDSHFLYYFITKYQERLKSLAGSTTIPIVNKSSFEHFEIIYPPIPEQNKIAEILSTVDDAIENTDAIIEETQQLKKGLMQKFFENKAFALMKLANKWKTKLKPVYISDFGKIVTGSTPSTSNDEYYNSSDYMFIGPADLGEKKNIDESQKYISKKGFNVIRKLPQGSVMVVCIGATIGKVGITSEPCATNQQINSIIPKKEYSSDYVYYVLCGIKDYLYAFSGEAATPIINKGAFGRMVTFVHKDSEERLKIVRILSEIDSKIENEQNYKSELEQLKKGLLQVLLTGKVRVKVP